jgi:hypothetical protein
VWIYSSEQASRPKKGKGLKEEQSEGLESVCVVELGTTFTRLLLAINKQVFLLGLLPQQLKKHIKMGDSQYIDLVHFKHEQSLEELDYEQWYQDYRHPQLHIVESVTLKERVELLFFQDSSQYCVYTTEKGSVRQQLSFNEQQLY